MLTVAKGGDGQAEALVGSAVDTVGTGIGTKLEGIFQMSGKGTLDGLPPFVLSLQERIGGEHVLRPSFYPQPVNEPMGNVRSYRVHATLRETVAPESMKFFLQSTHFFTKFADVLLELLHVLPDLFHLLPHFLRAQRSNGEKQGGTE